MSRFAVTFGQKYRHADVQHPTFLPAHPDGYVVVVVPDPLRLRYRREPSWTNDKAREAARALLGTQWSFIYDMDDRSAWEPRYWPRGQIGQIELRHGSWVFIEPHQVLHDGDPQGPCWCEIGHAHDTEGRA